METLITLRVFTQTIRKLGIRRFLGRMPSCTYTNLYGGTNNRSSERKGLYTLKKKKKNSRRMAVHCFTFK